MEHEGTLSFTEFWAWLARHAQCIQRVGTRQSGLYDDDALHWNFITRQSVSRGLVTVQLCHGKMALGDIRFCVADIAHVKVICENEEWLYGCVDADGDVVVCFVIAHEYDGPESSHASGKYDKN